jgi:hypothetical protein
VQQETQAEAEARLLKVIANAQFQVFEDSYTFEALPPSRAPNPAALACVRDGEVWHQLVPISPRGVSTERFTVFSFHFKEELDASGFVGWLAAHLKRTVGTGVIVICGSGANRAGPGAWGLRARPINLRYGPRRLGLSGRNVRPVVPLSEWARSGAHGR